MRGFVATWNVDLLPHHDRKLKVRTSDTEGKLNITKTEINKILFTYCLSVEYKQPEEKLVFK